MSEQHAKMAIDEAAVEPVRPPDWLNLAARKKLGAGDDWRYCKWEAVGDDLIVEGGIPRELKSGPHKGRPTWRDSKLSKLVVTREEIEQEKASYESESGNCFECAGSAQEWAGWNHESYNRYRPCSRCSASGKAPIQGALVA